MDKTWEIFLEILKSSLNNEKAQPEREISHEQWQNLFHMAQIHNLLPMFYEAVYDTSALPKELPWLRGVKNQVMQQVVGQTLRTTEFLELNRKLQTEGITPVVVKGILCRELYPLPDHRPSGDEDVLIPEDQFSRCHLILLDFGMRTETLEEELLSAYEVPYRKDGSPLYIELHKHLFPPESGAYGSLNRFFEGVFDRTEAEHIQGQTLLTLNSTDHLFYLICHAFKHFLHSGFGIRQVCDIILYANRYGHQVDWAQILECCKEIRAEKFAAAIFQIGKNYLTFDPDRAAYPAAWRAIRVDEQPMLEDLLSAGLYGSSSMSRRHSSNITLEAVAAQKQGGKPKGAILTSLFPSAAKLENRYPYLRKYPWLLPAAWCSRIREYGRETAASGNNSAAEALKIGRERRKLLRIYGILK